MLVVARGGPTTIAAKRALRYPGSSISSSASSTPRATTNHIVVACAICERRWDFLEEERMMQYNRDKYFPELRTKVVNPLETKKIHFRDDTVFHSR